MSPADSVSPQNAQRSKGEPSQLHRSSVVLKHSPTLLFDILAESDKDKQKQKLLKGAVVVHGADERLPTSPATPSSSPPQPAVSADESGNEEGRTKDERNNKEGTGNVGQAASHKIPEDGVSHGGLGSQADGTGRTAGGADPGAAREPGPGPGPGSALSDGAAAPTAPAHPLAAPSLLEEFTPRVILQELLGELFIPPERLKAQGTFGQGAFATVQSCSLEDPDGGPSHLVAVKALRPEVLSDVEDLRRFLLEANLLRKLRHPNIVSTRGLGAHELASLDSLRASAYVVMEALEGGDLRMMVLRQMTGHSAAYSRLDALRWCLHIASACAYLHDTCSPMIIHRDLKLENVMLTGGPVDNRVAKITDFGLHKRAKYSRTEDVLIAVTNEWSTRGGSVYRNHVPASASSGRDWKDASYYGGSVYAGNAHAYGSTHHALQNSMHHNPSTSGRYAQLAQAGMAAARSLGGAKSSERSAIDRAADALAAAGALPPGPPSSAGDGSLHGSSHHGSVRAGTEAATALGIAVPWPAPAERPYLLAYDKRYEHAGGGMRSKVNSVVDLTTVHENAGGEEAEAAAAAATSAATSGVAVGAGAGQATTTRTSPFASAAAQSGAPGAPPLHADRSGRGTPLSAMQVHLAERAEGSGRAASSGHGPAPGLGSGAGGRLSQPAVAPVRAISGSVHAGREGEGSAHAEEGTGCWYGWAPPNAVAGPSLEETVQRKMLALMALETAAKAEAGAAGVAAAEAPGATTGSGVRCQGTNEGPSGAPEGDGAAGAGPEEPFSVTEFVRAAVSLPREESEGGDGGTAAPSAPPSAVTLMRSMSLALQQQQQQQAVQQQEESREADEAVGWGWYAGATERSVRAGGGAAAARAARAAAMKSVPEDKRMSMDAGSQRTSHVKPESSNGKAAGAAGGAGGRAAAAQARRQRRERVAEAAARMADATRQVGSLIYMAPELVTSSSYNEKVDVFSFAIIAYELFMGKLLAFKVANEAALARAQSQPRGFDPTATAPETRSAEAEAEEGVLAYVMRRSSAGAREAMPSWWPPELRDLIGRCWAQDPTQRPSFSKIFNTLKRMEREGTLAGMDAKDPTRGGAGCCTIC